MKDLLKKIKKGREKGISLRHTKFYRKAIRDHRKFRADCHRLESAWKRLKVVAVFAILTVVYSIYSAHKSYRLTGLLSTEYKELIEMQIAADKAKDKAYELMELVEENEAMDEEIKKLIDPLDERKKEAMSAVIRLLGFLREDQTDDGSIYCPFCNRKI